MLDAGRKYYSVDSIKQIIDNAAAAGFGYIMLGVGNDGMRFLLDDMSLLVGTLIPILLGVALGMSSGGSPLGAIFYIIAYNVILTLGMRLLYFKGYELGGKAVEMIVGEKANAIRESIIMLGTVVIGAVAASWISITTPLVLPGDISLQKDVLDTIFPKILPLGTVMLCYWLMSKKKMAPTTVMLVLVGIALVGVLIGFFDPQLAY